MASMITPPSVTANSRLMMRMLRDHGPHPRSWLSQTTGLSASSVTKAVAPLLELGWVTEGVPARQARAGRPAVAVEPVPDAISVCGIQLSIGIARIGLTDARAQVRRSVDIYFDHTAPATQVLAKIAAGTRGLLAASSQPCLGVGIAVPGGVDTSRRINQSSIYLGWQDVPVADELEARLGLPVVLDHNASAMALAEQRFGQHKVSNLAYIFVMRGVGVGLVVNGQQFRNGSNAVSELGHLRVEDPGEPCSCGATGCLETVVSRPALVRQLARVGVVLPEDSDDLIIPMLENMREDRRIEEVRSRLISSLANSLAAVVYLIHPELIIMGGIYQTAPDSLLGDLQAALNAATASLPDSHVQLAKPTLASPGISAGATIALESFVYNDIGNL